MPSVAINRPAPDFELPDYTGKFFRLSELQNRKNVLIVLNRGFV